MTERAPADTLVARPRCARSSRTCTSDASRRSSAAGRKIARQHEQDKLTARERLALLIDEGTFTGARHPRPAALLAAGDGGQGGAGGRRDHGYGKVDGRLVAVAAYDFTVMAGSMGMTGE